MAPKIGEKKGNLFVIKTAQLNRFLEEIEGEDVDDLVRRFRIDYHTAEGLIPSARSVFNIANGLNAKRILAPAGSFDRDLLEMLAFRETSLGVTIQKEVLVAAKRLAKKFKEDMAHAMHVETLCEQLFDALRNLHHLGEGAVLLLRVAAILHECGRFVSAKAHHRHSYYLIVHSEIFGLSRREIEIVALVARYHRHSPPKHSHSGYQDLSRSDRLLVAKLASILRVADALERSHSQRVRELRVSIEDRRLEITARGLEDVSLEQLAVNDKGDLFRQIFGLEIELRGGE